MATHAAPVTRLERLRESCFWRHAPRALEETARAVAVIACTMILAGAGMVLAGMVLLVLGLGGQVAAGCWQWINEAWAGDRGDE